MSRSYGMIKGVRMRFQHCFMTLRVLTPCWNVPFELWSKQIWENWHSKLWKLAIVRWMWADRCSSLRSVMCPVVYTVTAAVYREDLRPACSVCCICTNPCHRCSRSRVAPGDLTVLLGWSIRSLLLVLRKTANSSKTFINLYPVLFVNKPHDGLWSRFLSAHLRASVCRLSFLILWIKKG